MIPYVAVSPHTETVLLYESPDNESPAFEMDPEQTRELIVMLVGSVVMFDGGTDRIALLFEELLARHSKPERQPQ